MRDEVVGGRWRQRAKLEYAFREGEQAVRAVGAASKAEAQAAYRILIVVAVERQAHFQATKGRLKHSGNSRDKIRPSKPVDLRVAMIIDQTHDAVRVLSSYPHHTLLSFTDNTSIAFIHFSPSKRTTYMTQNDTQFGWCKLSSHN